MTTIKVDIVSATESLYQGEANRVFVPAKMGEIGVLPRHTQFLSSLRPGEVRIETDDKTESIYVSGGIVEVQPDSVIVLSDTAIRAQDLDEEKALAAKQRAEETLASHADDIGSAIAAAALADSIAQLRMIKGLRRKL